MRPNPESNEHAERPSRQAAGPNAADGVLVLDQAPGGIKKHLDRLNVEPLGLAQLVVLLVVGMVLAVMALSIAVVQYLGITSKPAPIVPVQIGPFTTYYSNQMPSWQLIVLALIGMAVVLVTAVGFEIGAQVMVSLSPRRRRLAAYRHLRPESSDEFGSVTVTVLIPAHNEAEGILRTLDGLNRQTRPPDRVVVVTDNCTDETEQLALGWGATVYRSSGNLHKKAGALNQALHCLLEGKGPADAILVMDADTVLADRFIECCAARLDADHELAAVGGRFRGDEGGGLLGQFQRNEYVRYERQIHARRGRVFVLTGTATMFRADALLDVAAARGIYIPGTSGQVYDTAALTEDNELTLALKSLGAELTSPDEAIVNTEIMKTWGDLWRQRKRWQRGALENLDHYGITATTIRYWGQQFGIGYGVVALNSAILLMVLTFVSVDAWIWFPFWIAVTSVFLVERVVTVWRGGWRARLLAALLVPEIAYDVYLQVVFVKSLFDISVAEQAKWGSPDEVVAS